MPADQHQQPLKINPAPSFPSTAAVDNDTAEHRERAYDKYKSQWVYTRVPVVTSVISSRVNEASSAATTAAADIVHRANACWGCAETKGVFDGTV